MKKVKFIKDHPSGIKKGHSAEVSETDAQRWVNQGYCTCEGMKKNDEAESDIANAKKATKTGPSTIAEEAE